MEGAMRRSRLRGVLWAVLVFGLPLSIVLQLWLGPTELGAPAGEQPGGELLARVVDEEGDPVEGADVELQLLPLGAEPSTHATAATDGEGRTRFDAPALHGKYRLLTGGGAYQRVGRERSFVDGRGRPVEQAEVVLEQRQGVQLDLSFSRAGSPMAGGTVWLEAKTLAGPLFGLFGAPITLEREFEGGECLLDGLPPLEGMVRVRFLDGTELTFQVEARKGRVELAYEV